MTSQTILQYQWPYLLTFFPCEAELATSARQTGAIKRRRAVDSASTLLRLVLAYGFGGLSLRSTAAWAEASELASISDVALLKRFRKSTPWLGHLLAVKLAERAAPPSDTAGQLQLRIVDATTVSRPGSIGTDWRVHLCFNLRTLTIEHAELTDHTGAENLSRFHIRPGEVVLGDRGYASRPGLYSVIQSRGDFVVRLGWRNVPLQNLDGTQFDLFRALRSLPEAFPKGFSVRLAPDRERRIPTIPVRLVAVRKTEAAATESRDKILREYRNKGKIPDPHTLEVASYVFVATSLSENVMPAAQVLDLYRFRWQIEMAFKRMKGIVELDALPAKEPLLSKMIILSKLLAALLLDDFTERFLSFSPWGYPLAQMPTIDLAHSKSPVR